jgi:hypothetical protein
VEATNPQAPAACRAPQGEPRRGERPERLHHDPDRPLGPDEARGPDAPCHLCKRDTPTRYRLMISGHVGNLCEVCGTARLRKPYVSRSVLQSSTPTPSRGKGYRHVYPSR